MISVSGVRMSEAHLVPLVDGELFAMTAAIGLADRLYPAFFAAIRGGVDDLLRAIDGGDRQAAGRLAHRLRGAAAQVGASRLGRALGEIEDALEGGDLLRAGLALSSLESLTTATIAALEATIAARRRGS